LEKDYENSEENTLCGETSIICNAGMSLSSPIDLYLMISSERCFKSGAEYYIWNAFNEMLSFGRLQVED
jgi:hypothetical protein